jgi:hypothetical protein
MNLVEEWMKEEQRLYGFRVKSQSLFPVKAVGYGTGPERDVRTAGRCGVFLSGADDQMSLCRVAVAILLCGPVSIALCPYPIPTPNNLYFHNDEVFTGKVLSARDTRGSAGYDSGVTYELSVTRWFKGRRTPGAKVFTERNSGAEYLDVGKSYLIFASNRRGRNVIGCGDTRVMPALEAIRELEKLANPRPEGEITVEVFNCDHVQPSCLLQNASVILSGRNGKQHTQLTGPNDRVRFKLPVGRYRVRVTGADKEKFEPHFLGLEFDEIQLSPGQEAAVAFVRKGS